jgi:hypothetical protein
MKSNAQEMFRKMREAHDFAVATLVALEQDVQATCGNDEKELADIAYALRETTDLADDLRKRAAALGRTAQSAACMLQVTLNGSAASIKTDYCTAALKMKTVVSIPKKDRQPNEYAALMDWLKVPRELWQNENSKYSAVEFHWPGLVDLISQKQSQGLPLPPGIDPNKTYVEYSLTMRGKKDVASA